ncbi:MAG TPA: SUMF1/EgtB/PvdO family nonheme iron enzyme [Labilithrix sp.]|nr:SUMF1/EgtB/PvdO family nonheme iron enzyme [Labilithrix sp.]
MAVFLVGLSLCGPEYAPREDPCGSAGGEVPPLAIEYETSGALLGPFALAAIAPVQPSGSPSLLPSPSPKSSGRTWQRVDGRYWQIVGTPGEPPEVTDARENNRGACLPGMVEVSGNMKQDALVDDLQLQACTSWIDRKWPERCAHYDRNKWRALSKNLPVEPLHFCIDRFEYPNRKGEYPAIFITWYDARDACEADGKRLCTEDEWTFACEGEEARPYPNGYTRDPKACLNDRPWRAFREAALASRDRVSDELDRLWQGLPSGARPLCKSPFGVYDMTGNVDEWTRTSNALAERQSVMKGGYWGPVRTRCRPATRAHDELHTFYQQGFRCCADLTN